MDDERYPSVATMVQAYLRGRVTLQALHLELLSVTSAQDPFGSGPEYDLAGAAALLLAEFSSGHRTEAELRQSLATAVATMPAA
ncbi:MAG: hypothetical protein IT303_12360 [Dehalococcoidia bacterium]|nr:hypothetical protein [Dehalococcoidia bacterium]